MALKIEYQNTFATHLSTLFGISNKNVDTSALNTLKMVLHLRHKSRGIILYFHFFIHEFA